MNIQQCIDKIENLKYEYDHAIARKSKLQKKDFENYISDTTIAFKDRWNTFVKSPYELSNFINKFAYFEFDQMDAMPEEKMWIMNEIQNKLFENTIDLTKNVDLKTMYGQYINEDGEVDLDNVRWNISFGDFTDEDLTFFIMTTTEIILKYNIQGFNHQMDMPYYRKNKAVSFKEYFNKQGSLLE